MSKKVRLCEICKQPFLAYRSNQLYCSKPCANRAAYLRLRNIYPVHTEQKKKEKRKSQVAEINRLAREAGMSYGQYTAKIFIEKQRAESMREILPEEDGGVQKDL